MTSIGDYAFSKTGLTSISIPDSVESIGGSAFVNCADLTTLTLTRDPAPTLGEDVFLNCDKLSIYVPDGASGYDEGEWANWSSKFPPVMALSDLTVSAGRLIPAFSPQVKYYDLILPAWVESFTFTPTLPGEGTVAVNGTEVPSRTPSRAFSTPPMPVAQFAISIELTRNGAVSSIYDIHASRESLRFPGGAISGVAAPARGGTPAETEFCTGTVTWAPTPNGTFAAGTAYTATITLAPKTGCTLTGVEANSFTVAGAESVTNDADSGVVTAVFPVTGPAPGGGSDDSGPSYYSRTLSDKATGVKVAGKQVYSTAKLTVEAGKLHAAGDPGCDLLRAAWNVGHVLGAWDLADFVGYGTSGWYLGAAGAAALDAAHSARRATTGFGGEYEPDNSADYKKAVADLDYLGRSSLSIRAIPAPGAVAAGTEIKLSTSIDDAVIYYTTDGNEPTDQSARYSPETDPLLVNTALTIKAYLASPTLGNSTVYTFSYTLSDHGGSGEGRGGSGGGTGAEVTAVPAAPTPDNPNPPTEGVVKPNASVNKDGEVKVTVVRQGHPERPRQGRGTGEKGRQGRERRRRRH